MRDYAGLEQRTSPPHKDLDVIELSRGLAWQDLVVMEGGKEIQGCSHASPMPA